MALAVPVVSFALSAMNRSCFIGKATALCALQGTRGAGNVIHAKFFAVAVAEIELGQIAVKVRFADMLIHAINAAFEDREKAFDGVGGETRSPSRRTYSSLL